MKSSSQRGQTRWIGMALLSSVLLFSVYVLMPSGPAEKATEHTKSEIKERMDRAEMKAARSAYFQRMLKDPETGRIPSGVRQKELAFARNMERSARYKVQADAPRFEWEEVGPNNIGGRTRALAVDVTNSDVIIAGGVSGGIWKSTDGGSSWELKSDPAQITGITSVAQDPRSGHTDTWYFTTGEFYSASAWDFGNNAIYFGTGVYKSTDNGESWQQMAGTDATPGSNEYQYDTPYDLVSRIEVNPQTGSVFIASNGFGIMKSTDGISFEQEPVLGVPAEQQYCDIEIASDGTMLATISQAVFGDPPYSRNPGVFVSRDDGETWDEVTPSTFPDEHERSVVAIAPSNTNYGYVMTYTGSGSGAEEDVRLHWINLSNGNSDDRSDNLPDFGGRVGFMNTQGNYNMTIAVHPEDPDLVLVGGINLFRSRNGFAQASDGTKDEHWVGGYSKQNTAANYPNQHADQHVLTFDPNDANRLWAGHDGGLSVTNDIKASSVSWQDMNNGYNVTQFYTVDLPAYDPLDRIMGGTQDNGTQFFFYTEKNDQDNALDVSSGDGTFTYFARNFALVSTQNGPVRKLQYSFSGSPLRLSTTVYVHPLDAGDQMFVHPWVIDPNNENYMFYPGTNSSGKMVVWRNDKLSEINNTDRNGTKTGWSALNSTGVGSSYNITELAVSHSNPEQRLYYGASSSGSGAPKFYRLDNARTSVAKPDSSTFPGVPGGSYVHDIAIHPNDADKVLVVLSNYNVTSLFYSDNGGSSWTAVEGNLGSGDSDPEPGPSVRAAGMMPTDNGTDYIVGTSVGVFTTSTLDGESTVWQREATNTLGYSIVQYMDVRPQDMKVALGSHGRGLFIGTHKTGTPIADDGLAQPEKFALEQNYPNPFNPSTSINYTLAQQSDVTITVFDLQGREVMQLVQGESQSAGKHNITFDAANLASGVYLYRLTANPVNGGESFEQTRKMTLMK